MVQYLVVTYLPVNEKLMRIYVNKTHDTKECNLTFSRPRVDLYLTSSTVTIDVCKQAHAGFFLAFRRLI